MYSPLLGDSEIGISTSSSRTFDTVTSTVDSSGGEERSPLGPELRTAATIMLSVVIVFTSGGNLLTIVVMRSDRRLRSKPVTSMYIASLASADLLVGAVVMTFMLLYTITYNGRWVFGTTLCTVWTCVDYVSCTASLTNVLMIAVDRYRSVSQPLKAIRRRNKRSAAWGVLGAWLTPTVFWVVVICTVKARNSTLIESLSKSPSDVSTFGANFDNETVLSMISSLEQSAAAEICDTDWKPPELIVVSVIIMFYVPLVAILVLFGLIMCVLRRHMVAFTGRLRTNTLTCGIEQSSTSDATTSAALGSTAASAGNVSGGLTSSVVNDSTKSSVEQRIRCSGAARRPSSQPEAVTSTSGYGSADLIRLSVVSNKAEYVVADIVDVSLVVRVGSSSTNRKYSDLVSTDCSIGRSICSVDGTVGGCSRSSFSGNGSAGYRTRCWNDPPATRRNVVLDDSSDVDDALLQQHPVAHWKSHLNNDSTPISRSAAAVVSVGSASAAAVVDAPPTWRRYAEQLRAQRQDMMQETRLRRQVKAARTLGAITGMLLLCWLPFTVMLATQAFCEKCLDQRTFDVAIWINYINSAANPVIYCLCNSQYRLAIRTLARRILGTCCCCCQQWCRNVFCRVIRH